MAHVPLVRHPWCRPSQRKKGAATRGQKGKCHHKSTYTSLPTTFSLQLIAMEVTIGKECDHKRRDKGRDPPNSRWKLGMGELTLDRKGLAKS
ncbi:hypothetical protein TNCV_1897601 [Trichonephila clavipes]|uniref:Uncharacterized protein n=1 Tax=Trichonephila clavipes TaxID=2585209 RepID=A0A8X6WFM3_TRICX|nr:hypothetical protein TNCV_1897601 [Trichonephila clavipes]